MGLGEIRSADRPTGYNRRTHLAVLVIAPEYHWNQTGSKIVRVVETVKNRVAES